MKYLHWELQAGPDDATQVLLDSQANVRLLDSVNYARFRRGGRHEYRGGPARRSPVTLVPPSHGTWHVVVDRGGYPGTVRASVQVLG